MQLAIKKFTKKYRIDTYARLYLHNEDALRQASKMINNAFRNYLLQNDIFQWNVLQLACQKILMYILYL